MVEEMQNHPKKIESLNKFKLLFKSKTHKLKASLREPNKWFNQFVKIYPLNDDDNLKMECVICMEDEIPFVLVKKIFLSENISDLIDHLFDYINPQIFCSKCAEYCCFKSITPYGKCIGAIPIIKLNSENQSSYLECISSMTDWSKESGDQLFEFIVLLFGLFKEKFLCAMPSSITC